MSKFGKWLKKTVQTFTDIPGDIAGNILQNVVSNTQPLISSVLPANKVPSGAIEPGKQNQFLYIGAGILIVVALFFAFKD